MIQRISSNNPSSEKLINEKEYVKMAKPGQAFNYNKPIEDALGFSAMIHNNGLLHLAGVISMGENMQVHAPGDMAAQIERIYDIIEETLAKCGANLAHVVNEVMYTTDMAKLMEAASARVKRYNGYAYPACTAVQVAALAFPDALLEVQVTAQLDKNEWSAELPPLGSPV
jgi:2-iminobutanoate/2-iminopropanoate deaminase